MKGRIEIIKRWSREPNNTRYTLSDYYWYPENFQFFFDGDHYTTADGMFDLLDPKAI